MSSDETAIGDNRYSFGFAGVALETRIKSILGSLWATSDEATAVMMINFYQELAKKDVSKAEALRQAQLSMLKDDRFAHPYYWSSFVLIGN